MALKNIDRYFVSENGKYSVLPLLRQSVAFSAYDLLDPETQSPPESIFGHFDLIICSNLLMYYNAVFQNNIIQKLIQAMAAGGYLITGESERNLPEKHPVLHSFSTTDPIFVKKARSSVR